MIVVFLCLTARTRLRLCGRLPGPAYCARGGRGLCSSAREQAARYGDSENGGLERAIVREPEREGATDRQRE
jgi:hypothetical protein